MFPEKKMEDDVENMLTLSRFFSVTHLLLFWRRRPPSLPLPGTLARFVSSCFFLFRFWSFGEEGRCIALAWTWSLTSRSRLAKFGFSWPNLKYVTRTSTRRERSWVRWGERRCLVLSSAVQFCWCSNEKIERDVFCDTRSFFFNIIYNIFYFSFSCIHLPPPPKKKNGEEKWRNRLENHIAKHLGSCRMESANIFRDLKIFLFFFLPLTPFMTPRQGIISSPHLQDTIQHLTSISLTHLSDSLGS